MPGKGVRSRRGALALAAAVAAAAPALVLAAVQVPALSNLEQGRWAVREIEGGLRHSVCLGDPAALLQLEHRGLACTREPVTADARGGTVQYSCRGRGFGRTSIRIETPRVVRIDTQGMANGIPFAYRAEAVRTGPCR